MMRELGLNKGMYRLGFPTQEVTSIVKGKTLGANPNILVVHNDGENKTLCTSSTNEKESRLWRTREQSVVGWKTNPLLMSGSDN